MHRYFFLPFCIFTMLVQGAGVYCQDFNAAADRLGHIADSLGESKQYKAAAQAYLAEARLRTMVPYKKQPVVNAGYYFALAAMPDSAVYCFDKAVRELGFQNIPWMQEEAALLEMRKTSEYANLLKYITEREETAHNPDSAKLITSDIDLFWKVYQRYQQDTSNAEKRFLTEYFEKGSPGLQDYYKLKTSNIGGLKGFVKNIAAMPSFYKSIRANTLRTKLLLDTFHTIFRQLKNWYPQASFPNTTFVIGGWSSGGTATDYGALVGADMQSADNATITKELNLWQQKNLIPFSGMKHVVAHELIHVQQNGMGSDTILLCFAIKEGMADFIGELTSGKTANERLHKWAKGREQKIWEDFKKEMLLNRYSNWIANNKQETPDHPADLGYWVGYQICKSYFEEMPDKKKAIDDMFHIKDYQAFLLASKTDEKMRKL